MKENISQNYYEMFASVLSYPVKETLDILESSQGFLNSIYPDAASVMNEFIGFVKTIPILKWEEIYTRTFDVQAITTLDTGYVLFGDDYKRGELLVNLSKEHTIAGNDCGTELADHLPNLLRLLGKVSDEDFKNDLIYLIIKPALKRIISEFSKEIIDKKNQTYERHHKTLIRVEINYFTVYKLPLKALLLILDKDFPDDVNESNNTNDLHMISKIK